jgi:hypothetical protein
MTATRSTAPKAAALDAATITVSFGGHDYYVPPSDDWSITVLEHAENGRTARATAAILGAEQYNAFRSRHSTVKELNDFSAALGKAVGTGN